MLRQAVRAVAQMLERHRRAVALVALAFVLLLVGGGYSAIRQTAASHQATALDITVVKRAIGVILSGSAMELPPPAFPPDVQVFEKTITDVGLVRDVQHQLDSVPQFYGDCGLENPSHLVGNVQFVYAYIYTFRFSTLGVTTQVYKGDAYCTFSVSTLGVSSGQIRIYGVTLYGVWILEALHQRTGMPCMVNCADGAGPSDGDTSIPCCGG